ncbi:MAG TPA: methyltransferase domain-containing protein [Candidatus Angelobacter sp.]|nr:methyltransferase domain-containing protein [Candidatus Angelobacter sp.]
MPGWDANLYLKFSGQRGRPAADLVAQIALENPQRIVDLGCGTGNSTEQVQQRWPNADITGVDNSSDMLSQARANHPGWKWVESTVEAWEPKGQVDLIFSNACLHWVADHATLFPRLFGYVAPGGAMAVQMPNSYHLPAHTVMHDVAADPRAPWAKTIGSVTETYSVKPIAFYYDLLRKQASRLNIWQTEYLQIMDGPEAVLDWVSSTAMRRFTEPLPNDEQRKEFRKRCLERIRLVYPANDQGKTLFPYFRMFVVAYR